VRQREWEPEIEREREKARKRQKSRERERHREIERGREPRKRVTGKRGSVRWTREPRELRSSMIGGWD
jgi:hypothetical protein